MIVLASTGYFPWTLDFVENETFDQMIVRFRNTLKLEFRSAYTIQDTNDGRIISGSEIVSDNRRYNLTAWITAASHT